MGQLCTQALYKSAVHAKPLIHKRHTKVNTTNCENDIPNADNSTLKITEERGDLHIRGFWTKGTDCIVDVRMTDTDSTSYLKKDPANVLAQQENEKKRKYSKKCTEQHKNFTPFIISIDGLLGNEAKSFLQHLSRMLAEKWQKPYSQVRGYVNSKISIACLRATHLCIRGCRVPTTFICRSKQWEDRPWEDGAGLGLFKSHQ